MERNFLLHLLPSRDERPPHQNTLKILSKILRNQHFIPTVSTNKKFRILFPFVLNITNSSKRKFWIKMWRKIHLNMWTNLNFSNQNLASKHISIFIYLQVPSTTILHWFLIAYFRCYGNDQINNDLHRHIVVLVLWRISGIPTYTHTQSIQMLCTFSFR